jgi:hypothetical protein
MNETKYGLARFFVALLSVTVNKTVQRVLDREIIRYAALLLCASINIWAGSISISSSVSLPAVGDPASGSFELQGNGSYVIVPGKQISDQAPISSVSLSGSAVSGSASVSGPSEIADPFEIDASGTLTSATQITKVLTLETSSDGYSYQPTAGVSEYDFLSPALSMLFEPAGVDGYAAFAAFDATLDENVCASCGYYVTSLGISVTLSGSTGAAAFIWDASTGDIALKASPGVSGTFEISSQVGTGTVYLLDYEFQTSALTNALSVIMSTNTLGLTCLGQQMPLVSQPEEQR